MPEINYQKLTLLEFNKFFPDENFCKEHMFKIRWPKGFVCPLCGNGGFYFICDRALYQCTTCRHQTSLTAGTVMHKTKTPLLKWFWAIYLASTDKRGISALALSKKISISHWVAWTMLHKIRKAMADRDARYQLAGLIQVDDAYLGGDPPKGKGKTGRGTQKTPMVVEVSVSENNKPLYAKMHIVSSVSSKEITNVISKDVSPGQKIVTDGWQAYQAVEGAGFSHCPTTIYNKPEKDFDFLK